MYFIYIIAIIMSRPIPQTSVGRLIGLTVDNSKYHTSSSGGGVSSSPPPPLIPISAENNNKYTDNSDELTMIWRNVATLFAKYDNIETDIETQGEATKRCTDEVYQEIQDLRNEFSWLQAKQDDAPQHNDSESSSSATIVRKIRKYVNKKCAEMRETLSYGSYNADNEIFDYVNKTRADLEVKNKRLEDELGKVYEEMEQLNETYYRDYEMFIQRENNMMAKLDAAVKQSEETNQRMKDLEDIFMRQIQQTRNYADTHVAGGLREEFSKAICREVEYESNISTKMVQSVNDDLTGLITRSNEVTTQRINYLEDFLLTQIKQGQSYSSDTQVENRLRTEFSDAICRETERVNNDLTDLITRSNQYHSTRYFGTVEDVKQLRETCQTLKESIGMVDAELSDTKETVEQLKDDLRELDDDVYHELDRDYYDLKDYVKRRISRHEHREHSEPREERRPALMEEAGNALQQIAEEYGDDEPVVEYVGPIAQPPEDTNEEQHVIIIDENIVISDDEDEFAHT